MECLKPWYPDESRADAKAGKARYPEKDERLGFDNDPLSYECGRCPACVKNRQRRYAGRALAELQTSVSASFVTCTYADDKYIRFSREKQMHPHAAELHGEDAQLWLKRVRRAGYPLSYMQVYERGDDHNRWHLHTLCFWKAKPLPFAHGNDAAGRNWNDPYWPHGMTHYKAADEAAIDYLCNYILPAEEAAKQSILFRRSTKPPIGHTYFTQLARRWVELGNVPMHGDYRIPGSVLSSGPKKGLPKRYTFDVGGRDRFMTDFVRLWYELRPGQPLPESDYLLRHLDRVARGEVKASIEADDAVRRNVKETGSYYDNGHGLVVPRSFRIRG